MFVCAYVFVCGLCMSMCISVHSYIREGRDCRIITKISTYVFSVKNPCAVYT